MYPDSLKKLIDSFKLLPGIGSKTAERLAFSMLDFDKDKLSSFADSICDIRDKITKCDICGNISDSKICNICGNSLRDNSIILVVERPKDIILFEKIGSFNGEYHVLNGVISPLDGIGPEDINLFSLIDRVSNNDINEVIFALKPSVEGETTIQYIKKLLEGKSINISKIAIGVPIGTDMEYIDSITLEMAIDERKIMN
ncbi:MAG: recombination mediator RecR [Bacilli bacterium]|nr:recombination mediator RecR [Bacilli bacterium]